ncbi:ribonuclease H family protein [Peptoniphilus equinus]|uniref:ribonuclease H n=1 Tax=Peptoniphilus equinus TaxID=3016343 RepID=A0ABY7QVH9_9FIRM|nr:ribonuclease H family protein [Peptoniphilus equinus]WBW50084.1 ribonuclease H family protein [Peptoniphilus equinus]
MNYYAVRVGRTTGVLPTWEACKAAVHGYKGAEYKKFTSEAEAQAYVQGIDAKKVKDQVSETGEGELIAYVDGSYRLSDSTFSYGYVLTDGTIIIEEGSKRFSDADASLRNVAGEIRGAMRAMERAIELGYRKLYLHYDYKGIEAWATGDWRANKTATKAYRDSYQALKGRLVVEFIKVEAHTGVALNERADVLAKEAQ